MITTSEGLQSYDPHRRQCYLQSERHLLFFKGYTQQNCQLECLTNHTLKICGCVAYHMPRKLAINWLKLQSSVCFFAYFRWRSNPYLRLWEYSLHEGGWGYVSCMKQACCWACFCLFADEYLALEVEASLQSKLNDYKGCDCLPSCTSLTYNAETSQADFNWEELFWAYKANVSEFPGYNLLLYLQEE